MYKKYNFESKNNYFEVFKLWLKSKGYNSSTIRNYLVDLKKYLLFADNQNIFLETTFSNYLSQISKENNYQRQLASLNKFCQFAIDQKMISFNPLKKLRSQNKINIPSNSLSSIIQQYQSYLFKKDFTQNSIKNYINDINQYVTYYENK
jgi:site-specific recombinase XerD